MLKPFHPELPADARTLLQTTKVNTIRSLDDGNYNHFGIKSGLIVLNSD